MKKKKGTGVKRKKAAGLRTGSGLGAKKVRRTTKASGMRAGATKTKRKKKKGGYFGEKIVNKVINAAGTVVGAVVGGVYKAGKAAARAATKKGGAKRVKKKAGMQLGGATRSGRTAPKSYLGGAKPKRKRRANPWLAHVKRTMASNKGMAFKAVLKKAKASYKKK